MDYQNPLKGFDHTKGWAEFYDLHDYSTEVENDQEQRSFQTLITKEESQWSIEENSHEEDSVNDWIDGDEE